MHDYTDYVKYTRIHTMYNFHVTVVNFLIGDGYFVNMHSTYTSLTQNDERFVKHLSVSQRRKEVCSVRA